MLDIKFIKENVDKVKAAIKNKNEKADIDLILDLDNERRKTQYKYDILRAEQKKVSKIIPQLKKQKADTTEILDEMSKISLDLKTISSDLNDLNEKLDSLLQWVPNIPHQDVPVGKDETSNRFVKDWGKKTEFNFKPLDHLALSEKNNLLDLKRVTKITGSGFVSYVGEGAAIERALINFMLDFHIKKHNYLELSLPVIVNRKSMYSTGQLPKLEEDMYLIAEEDFFLVPTAEVSITNFHQNEILSHKQLPLKYVSYSPCFRREAGSYGKDTKGLQRLHQFNKVEMVRLVKPQESYQALEQMLIDAEDILKALGLHYRVVTLATGDLSFASAKTYDIEVWAPGSEKYFEVSSISNFEDFQARRASIRFRDEDNKVKYLHTLNGSGLATPRTMIALLETYQQKDGKIDLPECLTAFI
jgi:seryl-tRNA synthetase